MRFRFEHGGRSGIRDPEAMAFALEQYLADGGRFGDLLVDFSATNDRPGELFRAKDALFSDLVKAATAADEAKLHADVIFRVLADRYWAEGEATLLERTAPPSPDRGRRGAL